MPREGWKSVAITKSQWDRLSKFAEDEDRSVNNLVGRIVEAWLKERLGRSEPAP